MTKTGSLSSSPASEPPTRILMCCSIENNLALRKVVVMASLLLAISSGPAECCDNCEPLMIRVGDDTKTARKLPLKKDIFMSRGWGAGGGAAFTSRRNPDLFKKNRMVAEMISDEANDQLLEPRVEFLRSPAVPQPVPVVPSRRRLPVYVPQLFISSGWGPLGK